MSETLPRAVVVAALTKIGLFQNQAEQAADDARITWTEDTVGACIEYTRRSTAHAPAATLLTQFLKHGKTPPILTPIDAPPVEPTCDACGGLLADCEGLHGWAAQYRSTAVPLDEAAAA